MHSPMLARYLSSDKNSVTKNDYLSLAIVSLISLELHDLLRLFHVMCLMSACYAVLAISTAGMAGKHNKVLYIPLGLRFGPPSRNVIQPRELSHELLISLPCLVQLHPRLITSKNYSGQKLGKQQMQAVDHYVTFLYGGTDERCKDASGLLC